MSTSRAIATLLAEGKTTPSHVYDVLAKYHMLSLLPSIVSALGQYKLSRNDVLTIMIESPFSLSDDAIIAIKNLIGTKDATHSTTLNKDLLAGFKARYRGMLYDGSAERIIKQLRNTT
jgi:F0F1-type ATP synthase delta subunit